MQTSPEAAGPPPGEGLGTVVRVCPGPRRALKRYAVVPVVGSEATVRDRSFAPMAALPEAESVAWTPPEWVVVAQVTCTCSGPSWAPSPLKSSWGKPSNSSAGSKASPPSVSPKMTVALRRSVSFCVVVEPLPQAAPGS